MERRMTKGDIVKLIIDEAKLNGELDEDVARMILDSARVVPDPMSSSEKMPLSDVISDRMAMVAGSWTFLISFCLVIIVWITINTMALTSHFDPYPYIFLNLVLSCIAALQAPLILMSQNRQDAKDRVRAENDFVVNLKSELMLEFLHDKLDRLIEVQTSMDERIGRLESDFRPDSNKK